MQFLKDFNPKTVKALKIAGLILLAIVVVGFILSFLGSSFGHLDSKLNFSRNSLSPEMVGFDNDDGYAGESEGSIGLSVRNVTPTSPDDNGSTIGDDAENFEVTEYSASIETRKMDKTCATINNLKSRDDVIFESAKEYEKSCNYKFKVKNNVVEEILAIIEELDPKELNENTYTIKPLVEDYTSELDILKNKLESIEETLETAVSAYDDITKLAIRTDDAESLAKIIDSKIGIIERLTQQKINVNAQLERLMRSKAEQLDRLEYTYFYVYVIENKFIDGQNLKDSWKEAIKSFVNSINKAIQGVTINMLSLLFSILSYVVYLFIILFIAKYSWKLIKKIWKS